MKRIWLLLFMLALPTAARVGGGESYSGGGSSHSGDSGGDSGAIGFILELLIRLIFYYPQIGIPLLIVGAVIYYTKFKGSHVDRQFRQLQNWSAANSVERRRPPSLTELTKHDPNFSPTLFLDFVTSLYSKVLTQMGRDLSEVGGYLEKGLRARLESGTEGRIDAVIIGSTRLLGIHRRAGVESVEIEIESNLSQEIGNDLYVVDHLTLQRAEGVKTNPPETVYTLACPSCGNTGGIDKDGHCSFCDQMVNTGRWSWVLTDFRHLKSTAKPPVVLSSSGLEIGTELPTEKSATLQSDLAALQQRDAAFQLEGFQQYARQTFLTLQQAWTELKWERARPLETDSLFQQHQYWMECYKTMGYRNVLEDVSVTDVQLSQVTVDKYFEGITLRMFASMKDYTVSAESGEVLSGSPEQTRKFSEYWTFVRRVGVTSKEREAARCPSCGAPLDKVTEVGICEYCQSNITRGDFDWVLSRIEQDEAYFV